jgi:hypothetical protein
VPIATLLSAHLAAANLASVRPADAGSTIAVALADPTVIVVMVNPDGRLWIELSPLRPPPLRDRQDFSSPDLSE